MKRPASGSPSAPNRWAAAAAVYLGLFLLGMDLTVLNVALPDLSEDLRPSMEQLQWIVDGYALVLGGTVLAAGLLTDRLGRRRAFLTGCVLCALSSVPGALTDTPGQVIAARGGMGAGASLLMPATLSTLHHLFPEAASRRRAIALWTAVYGAGGLTGPLIGGWLVEHFSWRAGFWINVPLAAAAVVLALLFVPESRAPLIEPLDLPGIMLCAVGLLALVWAIIESPVRGWTSPPTLTAFTVAALVLAAFTARQARARFPILPPAMLRRPQISVSTAVLGLMCFALFGALFVTTLYLQGVLGYTPWQAGLRTLPLPAGLAAGALAAPLLSRHWGDKASVVAGLATVTIAFAVLAHTTATSGYGHLVVFQAAAGIGAGMTATAATETIMAAVPPERAALGSAINDATRQIGAALGVAVQGSVLATVYTDQFHNRMGLHQTPLATSESSTSNILAAHTLTTHLPEPAAHRLLEAAQESFISGLTLAAVTAGTATALAAVSAAYGLPNARRHTVPSAAPIAPIGKRSDI